MAAAALAAAAAAGFLAGVVFLALAEVAAVVYAFLRLRRHAVETLAPEQGDRDGEPRPLGLSIEKQGHVWILEPNMIPKASADAVAAGDSKETKAKKKAVEVSSTKKNTMEGTATKEATEEAKEKKSIVEVNPVKKLARIEGHELSLSGLDGSKESVIQLRNCTVVTVSSSSSSSRKWAKRYPIKLESTGELYNGAKTCYIYFETSWEKESWCKALRLAASPSDQKRSYYDMLSKEFHSYISSMNAAYPHFLKPSSLSPKVQEQPTRIDGLSRARNFFKRFSRKNNSKAAVETKGSFRSTHQSDPRSNLAESLLNGSSRSGYRHEPQDSLVPSSPDVSLHSNVPSSEILNENISSDDSDEGTLCWNLLFARLFFDVKKSSEIRERTESHIKQTLSKMRTPSYIGDFTLKSFSLGELPPHVSKMRVLPGDLNELWAFEVDFEYSGGININIETRLEVHAPELEKDILKNEPENDPSVKGNTDVISSNEQSRKHIGTSTDSTAESELREGADPINSTKGTGWTSGYRTRWKTFINSIADNVSQVPLSLTIKIASVRGSLRLHLKPPPADQLWYGFSSLPDIDWDLESSIGDKILRSSHISSLIGSRFRGALRETLVLPNYECVCIPWMLADKDDWIPRKEAPFLFRNHEGMDSKHGSLSPSEESKSRSHNSNADKPDLSPDKRQTAKNVVFVEEPRCATVPSGSNTLIPSTSNSSYHEENEDMKLSLVTSERSVGNNPDRRRGLSLNWLSRQFSETDRQASSQGDDGEQKKSSRRAKMMDFGKKMGDKFVEKRRDFEEKSKSIVERIKVHGFDSTDQLTEQ